MTTNDSKLSNINLNLTRVVLNTFFMESGVFQRRREQDLLLDRWLELDPLEDEFDELEPLEDELDRVDLERVELSGE